MDPRNKRRIKAASKQKWKDERRKKKKMMKDDEPEICFWVIIYLWNDKV